MLYIDLSNINQYTMRRTKENVLSIYEEYINGETMYKLDLKHKTSTYYLFNKYKLETRTTYESIKKFRKSAISLSYQFEKINNEYEAYITGFFMADGYVSKHQLGIKLQKRDYNTLLEIKNYFSNDIKLQSYKNSVSFVVSSMTACENAVKLGILKNKSTKRMTIPIMDENLLRHYIRGYFDGDGTIFVCNKNSSNPYLKSNICSSDENILKEIQNVLTVNGILSTINCEKRIGKTMKLPNNKTCVATQDMYRLYIRRKNELSKLFHFMYDNSNIHLDRKFNIFFNNYNLMKRLK